MKRFLSILLVICTLMMVPASSVAAADTSLVLRIGLYYSGNALAAPQLQNEQGSGYQAGYYDSAKTFHSLFSISATKLVMLKAEGNYVKSSSNTYEETTGTPTVGAYHVQKAASYTSQSEATAAASAVGGFVSYDGSYHVRIGNYATLAAAQAAAGDGQTAVGGTATGVTVVQTDTGTVLFTYDGSDQFAIAPQGVDKPVTWFKGYKYYGNFAYLRTANSNLSVINYVELEDYVKGVVPYEMSPDWNVEALKAQAVCARSYAMQNLNKHKTLGFDLCNTTDCQVYRGRNSATDNSDSAVEHTAGQYAVVDGSPVTLFFFAADGGATEDSENVWGGSYSYLKGVQDPYEDTQSAYNGIWSVTFSAAEVAEKLQKAGYIIGAVTNVAVTKKTAMGNVLQVTVTDASGSTVVLEKAKCRTVFGLNSQRYTINGEGSLDTDPTPTTTEPTTTGSIGDSILSGAKSIYGTVSATSVSTVHATASTEFTFDGRGWGHLVGMSQCGAKAMAEQGMTYDQILKFYFNGIEIVN